MAYLRRRGFGDLATPCGQPGQPSCAGNQPNAYQRSIGIAAFNAAGAPLDASGNPWTPPGAGGTPQQMIAAQQALAGGASGSLTAGGGNLSYSTSSGNTSTPAVGDSWTISITGAPPGAAISVMGGQNGATNTTAMGSADSNGHWSKSGQFGSGQVGPWTEQWMVNGQPIGSWNYQVVQAATPSGAQPMQPAGFPSPGTQTQGLILGSAPSSSGGFSVSMPILGIPLWIWGIGAVGAVFFFSQGQHGRY